jgi:hypothetical protein
MGQNIVFKRLSGTNGKAPAFAGAFLYFWFYFSGLMETTLPLGSGFVLWI